MIQPNIGSNSQTTTTAAVLTAERTHDLNPVGLTKLLTQPQELSSHEYHPRRVLRSSKRILDGRGTHSLLVPRS